MNPAADLAVPLTDHARIIGRPLTPIEILEAQELQATDFHCTDSGNASLFARLHGEDLRYDHRRGRWLVRGGHRWEEDNCGRVYQLAIEAAQVRYLCAGTLPDGDEKRKEQRKWAVASESRQRLEATLALAQSAPPLADPGDRWDTDPLLLGVRNGVLDLRTGKLRNGRPEDRVTMQAGADFDPDAECPRFDRFLLEVFQEDADLVDFVHRALGYTLTGDVREEVCFVCYGRGCNGKTKLLGAVRHAAGDYACDTPFSTLETSARASIPNDVAALAGRRLVTASETGEDRRLNEARIKALTGGDPITARFLYGELFTFQPVGKFWLGVNHKPRVRDDSAGFWRRIRLIPFGRSFEGQEDRELEAKLANEAPGILAWLVRGCLAWQARGLEAPGSVTDATAGYREDSDPLAGFIDSACVVSPTASAKAGELYTRYTEWAAGEGLSERERLTSKVFGQRLSERFDRTRDNSGRIYIGIGVRRV